MHSPRGPGAPRRHASLPAVLGVLAGLGLALPAGAAEVPERLLYLEDVKGGVHGPGAPSSDGLPFSVRDAEGRRVDLEALRVPDPEPPAPLEHWEPRHPKFALRSLLPPLASLLERRKGMFRQLFGLPARRAYAPLETRYPVILLHGANVPKILRIGPVRLKYFSKTEAHLRRLNLRLLVPEVNPFGSIEERAHQLEEQIRAALPEGKFNLVAHSMGGLDARWLAHHSDLKDRIASITTVATPHHGSWYADFADEWVFRRQGLYKLLGLIGLHMDQLPDLTVRKMADFNAATPDNPDVAYFSYGTFSAPFAAPPFYWGMHFIMRISEKRAASRRTGRPPDYGPRTPVGVRSGRREVLLDATSVDTLERVADARAHDWIVPKWAGRNDGVVSLSSSVWGEYLGSVKTHHWGPMGWLTRVKEQRLWEELIRRLAAQGF